jgi:peptidoglycan hydrolase FlgJ
MNALSAPVPALSTLQQTRIDAPSVSSSHDRLREKAVELEGVFLNTLMSQMFSSLDARNEFGGGYAEETWRGMQAEQYSSMIAENGGIGLADDILADLLTMQEAMQDTKQDNTPLAQTQGAYSK